MRKYFIICFVLMISVLFAQSPVDKLSARLKNVVDASQPGEKTLIWVFFNDKGNNLEQYYNQPTLVVSQKSLQRRAKVLKEGSLIKSTDLPVNENYINQLKSIGFVVKQKSRWFNGVSGYATKEMINQLNTIECVKKLDAVMKSRDKYLDNEDHPETLPEDQGQNLNKGDQVHSYNYGPSFTQLNQINVPAVHDMGFHGEGITICMMDAGFDRWTTHQAFSSLNVIAAWDFVNGDPNVEDEGDMGTGSHGTSTLSLIGGFDEGQLIGPAFAANFILTKTENTDSETPIEEDNWIAALEWADSIGVDITSTSLSYLDYDPPYTSYTWEDMDGNTALITKAADLAVGLGIFVVNAASNSGYNPDHNTLGAPADGDSVVTIGSVTSGGTRSSFSSVGPTVDGRIKPDLMAMGSNDWVACNGSNTCYSNFGSGTSWSTPLSAGASALLLQADPSLTPIEMRTILRSTASQSSNPDNLMGWGIIDLLAAVQSVITPVELTTLQASVSGEIVTLNWQTATETNNQGFYIERKFDGPWETRGYVSGRGTTTEYQNYSFKDNVNSYGAFQYRLKQVDLDGSFHYSEVVQAVVGTPQDFYLSQNYPNPFNPSTKLEFQTPVQSDVVITLNNILGEEIAVLYSGVTLPGKHDLTIDGSHLSSGLYLVRMKAENVVKTIKITLLK
jgi:serine protease AprX